MENKTRKVDIVKLLGFVGILAVSITIISDFILIGKPGSGDLFFKLGTESMAEIAQWRITVGAFLGVVALPFQVMGLLPIYYGLKPAGRVIPLIVVITNAHALLMGVAFHIAYAFIGSSWRLYYKSEPGNKITSEMVNRFDSYWKILIIIIFIEILFSSILYVMLILKGNTRYPKWMALLNQLCIAIVILPFIYILPAPIGGYIAPACLNISTMVFFIMHLKIWKLKESRK